MEYEAFLEEHSPAEIAGMLQTIRPNQRVCYALYPLTTLSHDDHVLLRRTVNRLYDAGRLLPVTVRGDRMVRGHRESALYYLAIGVEPQLADRLDRLVKRYPWPDRMRPYLKQFQPPKPKSKPRAQPTERRIRPYVREVEPA